MADSVKISDLPTLPSLAINDVIIINDTSTGVTSKAAWKTLFINTPNTSITPTGAQNTTISGNILVDVYQVAPLFAIMRIRWNGVTISNETVSQITPVIYLSDNWYNWRTAGYGGVSPTITVASGSIGIYNAVNNVYVDLDQGSLRFRQQAMNEQGGISTGGLYLNGNSSVTVTGSSVLPIFYIE